MKKPKQKRVFDPKKQPASQCPLLKEWLDQTGCGDGTGSCAVYPQLVGNPDAELGCPKSGPRGGNLKVAPDDCPLRVYELILVRKAKANEESA